MNLKFLNQCIKGNKVLESLSTANRLELANNIKIDKMLMITLLILHSISNHGDVVGDQYKSRVYEFGCHQHFGRSYNGSSNEMCSNENNKELAQEIEDMCATNKRIEEEIIKSNKKLELVITENRQREQKLIEEGRQREENLKEMVRKMIQEGGYANYLYPGGSGPRERHDR